MEENAAAAALCLEPSDLEGIDAAVPRGAAAGDRYSAIGMRFTES